MSRHRAVRNLDLDDELYDDFGESTYDELQDISEEDEARLLEGVEAVKGVIGRSTGISDQEIKETLYYYYFDIDASRSTS
ncbi:hypothetical protein EC988_004494 [Linderina pennispora]|nr:hypothetical protein EC988_004494 [Linderina pennispora]